MRIGFDAKRLFLNDSGLGNYSRTLVQHMRAEFPEDELLLFTPRIRRDARRSPFLTNDYRVVTPKRTPKALHSWWRSVRLASVASKQRVDIFHGLSHELPPGLQKSDIPSVVTMHDLIFLRFPEMYPRIDRAIYEKKVRKACETADRIVAISERTAMDLQELLSVPGDRIEVIYQGCDPVFRKHFSDEAIHRSQARFHLMKPYLLSIGTLEQRKNQINLIKAYAEAGIQSHIDLVLIGRKTEYVKQLQEVIDQHGLRTSVKLLDGVGYNDLPLLLQGAKAMIYPSRYEGFGLPVLEAMSMSVPVIAASGSCLEEVGGDAALYAHPDDVETFATHIQQVVDDEHLREGMREAGRQRTDRFNSADMAKAYHRLYSSLL